MIHPVLYEEYKRLHDERAERMQREAQVHAWLRSRSSQRTPLRRWIAEGPKSLPLRNGQPPRWKSKGQIWM